MGAQKSYRNVGDKEKTSAALPRASSRGHQKLVKLYNGVRSSDESARWSNGDRDAMELAIEGRIRGFPAGEAQQLWLEGCAAPCVTGTVISFTLETCARSVARQPIPSSPYDELRTQ